MKKRKKIQNKAKDKRVFTTTALRVHPKNLIQSAPERGGYRL